MSDDTIYNGWGPTRGLGAGEKGHVYSERNGEHQKIFKEGGGQAKTFRVIAKRKQGDEENILWGWGEMLFCFFFRI